MNARFKPVKPSTVFICSTLTTPNGLRHTILDGGRYFIVDDFLLAALKQGETVQSLELEEAEVIEDEDDTPVNRMAQMKRSGAFGGM